MRSRTPAARRHRSPRVPEGHASSALPSSQGPGGGGSAGQCSPPPPMPPLFTLFQLAHRRERGAHRSHTASSSSSPGVLGLRPRGQQSSRRRSTMAATPPDAVHKWPPLLSAPPFLLPRPLARSRPPASREIGGVAGEPGAAGGLDVPCRGVVL